MNMVIPEWFQIGASAVALISGIVYAILKLLKKRKHEMYMSFWSTHSQIHETLTELRVLNDCARVHLVQFHNGEYFLDGVSMKKLSLTHESLNKGTSGEGDKIQGLLISRFVPLMNKLIQEDSSLFLVEDMEESYFNQFMVSGSILAFIVLPIKYRGMITGYVMCQWCSWEKLDKLDEKSSISTLEYAKNTIEVLLSQQLRIKES